MRWSPLLGGVLSILLAVPAALGAQHLAVGAGASVAVPPLAAATHSVATTAGPSQRSALELGMTGLEGGAPDGGAGPATAKGQRADLAAADEGFVDTRRGRGWGDKCYLHWKAGRFGNAKAACEKGLKSDPEIWTQGALYYNLGIIAESEHDLATARRNYERSLEVRPNDRSSAIVRAALAKLPRP